MYTLKITYRKGIECPSKKYLKNNNKMLMNGHYRNDSMMTYDLSYLKEPIDAKLN